MKSTSRFYQTSPGKCMHFHTIYPPHLLDMTFDRKDFVLFGKLIQSYLALYEIRVPRTGVLPPDSASPRTPLLLANLYFCLRGSGLAPYSSYACRAHIKKDRRFLFDLFKLPSDVLLSQGEAPNYHRR